MVCSCFTHAQLIITIGAVVAVVVVDCLDLETKRPESPAPVAGNLSLSLNSSSPLEKPAAIRSSAEAIPFNGTVHGRFRI